MKNKKVTFSNVVDALLFIFIATQLLLPSKPTIITETITEVVTVEIPVEVEATLPPGYKIVPTGKMLLETTGWHGAYYGDGILVCPNADPENASVSSCVHELGHLADDFAGKPSETIEFEKAVEKYYWDNVSNVDNIRGHEIVDLINGWPGVLDNELRGGTWGGFGELYASMWSAFTLRYWTVPEEFEPFFVIPGSPCNK